MLSVGMQRFLSVMWYYVVRFADKSHGERSTVTMLCLNVTVFLSWEKMLLLCMGKVNTNDPVHTADIFGYHNDPTNEEIVNARLQELPAATMKQRGGPKK